MRQLPLRYTAGQNKCTYCPAAPATLLHYSPLPMTSTKDMNTIQRWKISGPENKKRLGHPKIKTQPHVLPKNPYARITFSIEHKRRNVLMQSLPYNNRVSEVKKK